MTPEQFVEKIKMCAELSSIAYTDDPRNNLRPLINDPQYYTRNNYYVRLIADTYAPTQTESGNFLFVLEQKDDPGNFIIAIRGTLVTTLVALLTNTAQDLFSYLVPSTWGRGNVNSGSLVALAQIDDLIDTDSRMNFTQYLETIDVLKSVTFTGHSLGGAVATTLASRFFVNYFARFNPSDISVISFGAPSPGDADFAEFVRLQDISITRVVNTLDPIPMFWGNLQNMSHVYNFEGTPLATWLDAKLKEYINTSHKQAGNEFKLTGNPLRYIKVMDMLAQHSILNYCDLLEIKRARTYKDDPAISPGPTP